MHRIFLTALAIVVSLALAGCPSALQQHDQSQASAPAQSKAASVGTYQEFDDVLIPNDLDLVGKNSFVFETPQFKTGILTYKGKVDAVSLANFFETELPKDNWKLRSKIKYNRTIMVFEKPDRDCIINIIDETFTTYLEIMVAPRNDSGTAAPSVVGAPPVEENLPK
ncbi:hypothetical protein [Desulfocurvus sp. DL9XJH121]